LKWVTDPVAYCRLHRFHMTVHSMKKANCINKKCKHFKKFKEHRFWGVKEADITSKKVLKDYIKNKEYYHLTSDDKRKYKLCITCGNYHRIETYKYCPCMNYGRY